jgi:DNA-binding transcriptional LysR family regulator
VDLEAVRTFVAVAGAGQFQEAAVDLSITQQAVSKRIAALERDLGVRLFTRTPRGARLTIDGQAFLPHARGLLRAEERAAASVRPGSRALRVDVVHRRIGPGLLMRDFHRAHPEIDLDVVTLFNAEAATEALLAGTIDATFRAVVVPVRELPDGIESARVYDEPLQLVTGPDHVLADAREVSPAQLAGHRIWIPGIVAGAEWAVFYEHMSAELGLSIDAIGPNFGSDMLLETIADSPALATFVGEQTRLVWLTEHDLRRIPVHNPTPLYPHSLLWYGGNPHPALAALRDHIGVLKPDYSDGETWVPAWARV